MKLMIKEIGEIVVDGAVKTESGDIQIFSNNKFSSLYCKTIYSVRSAYLVENELETEWSLITETSIPNDCEVYIDNLLCFDIENQGDVHKLNAFL